MSRNQSPFLLPVFIPLRHSRKIYYCVFAFHLFIMITVCIVQLSIDKWYLMILVGISFSWYVKIFRNNTFPLHAKTVLLNSNDQWFVINKQGEKIQAIILPGSFVHPRLILIRIRSRHRTIPIILLDDNLDIESLRRLRVRLRYPVQTQCNG